MKTLSLRWLLVAVVIAAVGIRFLDLGRSSVRTDEINFLMYVIRGQSLLDLWSNPPWLNQIPLADSIPLVWHAFRPGPPDEHSVREPFALIGSATVAGVAAWLARRRGLAAGVLVGVWMGLLPFHVLQSREAYYYVVVMAASAGMTLLTADLMTRLDAGEVLSRRSVVAWTAWTAVSCLAHMSTWVVAAVCWVLLLGTGLARLPVTSRKRHITSLLVSAAVIGVFMIRWVWRAFAELVRVGREGGHIGGDVGWVAPRVLPFFTAGANIWGVVLSLCVVCAGGYAIAQMVRKRRADWDVVYLALTAITVAGFAVVYAYIGFVGGGVAKITYFSVMLPVFLVWAAYSLDIVASSLPGKWPWVMRVAVPCAIAAVLAKPAWMITQLEGKPTPYKKLRDWLDTNLDPGSVVVIDRWLEPWNEMALYAPKNVAVTFTVPDHPYETYKQLRWRDVTQQAIEQDKLQGFIRLTRNHEARDGLWTWPESHFARRGKVVNDTIIWLHERGYLSADGKYGPPYERAVVEIFYDRREDALARKREAGEKCFIVFNSTTGYSKSGPLFILRYQTQEFIDWRVLEQSCTVDAYNLTDASQTVHLKVRGVAPRGAKTVVGPNGQQFQFGFDELQEWTIGPVDLEPGKNAISLSDPGWEKDKRPLLIADVEIVAEP
ncbi:MAG: hypothetical protein ACKOEX_07505 [Planctomycetia bacterium]